MATRSPRLTYTQLVPRSSYAAMRSSQFRVPRTGYLPSGSSANYHFRDEAAYFKLIEEARAIVRDDCVIPTIMRRRGANIISTGFTPNPDTGDPDVDKFLIDDWQAWSTNKTRCDIEREKTFNDFEKQALRSQDEDGDYFINLTDTGVMQGIEGHRVRTPANAQRRNNPPVLGIVKDENGVKRKALVTNDEVSGYDRLVHVAKTTPIDFYDRDDNLCLLHIFHKNRTSQDRGVTLFAPVLDMIGMHDEIQYNTLLKQQASSCYGFVETPGTDATGTPNVEDEIEAIAETEYGKVEGMGPGMHIRLPNGASLTPFVSNIPSPEYIAHVKMVLTIIAVAQDTPIQVLFLDPSLTNFSGWRGAIDEAKKSWKLDQSGLITQMHNPTWCWRVRTLMRADSGWSKRLRDTEHPFKNRWQPPVHPYMEPLKDASADVLRLANGIVAPSDWAAERGKVWKQHVVKSVADWLLYHTAVGEAVVQLQQKFPTLAFTRADFPGCPSSDGISKTLNLENEGSTNDKKQDGNSDTGNRN